MIEAHSFLYSFEVLICVTLWDMMPYGMVNRCIFAELHVVASLRPMILANELLHATQILNNLPFC